MRGVMRKRVFSAHADSDGPGQPEYTDHDRRCQLTRNNG